MSENKIKNALKVAFSYSQIDGSHHKMWVIDQMVRELTGCPKVTKVAKDSRGQEYTYEALGESEDYKKFIAAYCVDDNGDEYDWDVGSPP
jgi:hypothetical protein